MNNQDFNFSPMARPTKTFIENLKVGDFLPNCFGEMKKVTSIHYKGFDVNGKFFACFYQEFGDTSTMSNSIKEGELFNCFK